MAEMIDTAMFAADECPGLHFIRSSIRPNCDSVGLMPYQAAGAEWQHAMLLGEINSKEGYADDPAAFCDRAWHFLGPGHPSMVAQTMLTRD